LSYQGATPATRESFKKYVHVPGELGRKKITEIVHTRLDIKKIRFFCPKNLISKHTIRLFTGPQPRIPAVSSVLAVAGIHAVAGIPTAAGIPAVEGSVDVVPAVARVSPDADNPLLLMFQLLLASLLLMAPLLLLASMLLLASCCCWLSYCC